ncbi:MAG TPA: hypothetical protein V6C91_01220 [Coleofasciculaceae cyanobacterium]
MRNLLSDAVGTTKEPWPANLQYALVRLSSKGVLKGDRICKARSDRPAIATS